MENKFKVGDRVRCIDSVGKFALEEGKEYTVTNVNDRYVYIDYMERAYYSDRFELVERNQKTTK